MRILVYGAGVLGCNLANNLYRAKKNVTLLARGAWAERLKQDGLHIKKTFHLRESVSRISVITQLRPDDVYNVIFIVMRYTQLDDILEALRANETKNIVFVGNNVRAAHYAGLLPEKNVLFAFASSAGHREPARVKSIDLKKITIGQLQGASSNEALTWKIKEMYMTALYGIFIPFLGTTLGAGCVFFMKKSLKMQVQRALTGFAAGVMVAASIWSLLIPAMEQAAEAGKSAVIPAVIGFWLGMLFLLMLDRIIPHLHQNSGQAEGIHTSLQRSTMMLLAVTLHNIPEGMAVGVVYAGVLTGSSKITAAGALALSIGIAIQNFPEGAIISLPLRAEGMRKSDAFLGGVFSGIVEPIGAALTILAAQFVVPILPYLLSFSAGAMLYVVVEELIPEMSAGKHSNIGTIFFAMGFSVMMALDVMLG